jgi:hypothetical protein
MKKAIYLIIMVFLFSCEKMESDKPIAVEKFCWTCQFDYPNYMGYGPHQIHKEKCDKTEDEIRSYEKEYAWSCNCASNLNSHTVTCWKKY